MCGLIVDLIIYVCMDDNYVVIMSLPVSANFLRYSKNPHTRTCVVGVQADVVLIYGQR